MRSPSAAGSLAQGWSSLAGRRHELLPFTVSGVLCVIAGGLVAAVTASSPTEHGTWAAAYLVLVCGVAQAGLGLGQALFTASTSAPVVAVQFVGWNVGNAAVLVGTLAGLTALVDLGGGLLVVTLGLLARGLIPAAGVCRVAGALRCCLYGYRLLVLLLLVSIPVGLILARVRA